jgi:hypothetical protein
MKLQNNICERIIKKNQRNIFFKYFLIPVFVQEWKRPSELNGGAPVSLFTNGTSSGDIIQGALGDCYLLGAMASVATRDDLIKSLIVFADAEVSSFSFSFNSIQFNLCVNLFVCV